MINKIKSILLSMSAVIMFSFTAAIPATVMAIDCTDGTTVNPSNTNQCLCSGSNIDLTGNSSDCTGGNGGLGKLIRTIINVLSVIIGAIAVIMIIIGGFRYIVSAGNAEQAKSARNTILYAIIGLVIVALAQIIVHFVLNNTTNVTNP
jgi:cytochrome bd-type quinol oxidase subunit 2